MYVVSKSEYASDIDTAIANSGIEFDWYMFGGRWSGILKGMNCMKISVLQKLMELGLHIINPKYLITPDMRLTNPENIDSILCAYPNHFLVVVDLKQ